MHQHNVKYKPVFAGLQGEEAVKLEVKRQQISENVAAMAKAAEAAAARRLAAAEAAAQQKEVAKTVASTVAITITAPQATADADMPAAGAAASEQDHDGGDVEGVCCYHCHIMTLRCTCAVLS